MSFVGGSTIRKRCSSCSAMLADTDMICPVCGTRVAGNPQPSGMGQPSLNAGPSQARPTPPPFLGGTQPPPNGPQTPGLNPNYQFQQRPSRHFSPLQIGIVVLYVVVVVGIVIAAETLPNAHFLFFLVPLAKFAIFGIAGLFAYFDRMNKRQTGRDPFTPPPNNPNGNSHHTPFF